MRVANCPFGGSPQHHRYQASDPPLNPTDRELPSLDRQPAPVPRAKEGLVRIAHDLSTSAFGPRFFAAASRRSSAASTTCPSQAASRAAATRARARVSASMDA